MYTDGACSGNPGPGGWAWAVPGGAWASGRRRTPTNQRMEITAASRRPASHPGPVQIVTDSTYVMNCFQKRWYVGWQKNGWKNSQRKPVANRDLWEPFVELYERARRDHVPVGEGPQRRPDERPRRPAGGRGLRHAAAAAGDRPTRRPRPGGRPAPDRRWASRRRRDGRLPDGHRLVVFGGPPELGG